MTYPTRAQIDAWHDEAMENGSKTAINRLHDVAARLLDERAEADREYVCKCGVMVKPHKCERWGQEDF